MILLFNLPFFPTNKYFSTSRDENINNTEGNEIFSLPPETYLGKHYHNSRNPIFNKKDNLKKWQKYNIEFTK